MNINCMGVCTYPMLAMQEDRQAQNLQAGDHSYMVSSHQVGVDLGPKTKDGLTSLIPHEWVIRTTIPTVLVQKFIYMSQDT